MTKVYGWTDFRGRTQMRVIVRTASFAAACRAAIAVGLYKPRRDYTSESGNAQDLATTEGQEGIVFWRPLDSRDGDFVAVGADGEHTPRGRNET